ncbi:hypothetical protein V5O48_015833 [Marasmius crinis-equi]|uniref:Uncharacterized protein n=1 Tax=Marasmius crinis-equi TaxID=585013 RepID=A0ABR3ETF3_9AGAR
MPQENTQANHNPMEFHLANELGRRPSQNANVQQTSMRSACPFGASTNGNIPLPYNQAAVTPFLPAGSEPCAPRTAPTLAERVALAPVPPYMLYEHDLVRFLHERNAQLINDFDAQALEIAQLKRVIASLKTELKRVKKGYVDWRAIGKSYLDVLEANNMRVPKGKSSLPLVDPGYMPDPN